MRCPRLNELPPPPDGKTGWPWTEESEQASGRMPGGGSWPKISIVTPSYHQGGFIEETIRSVLSQNYPDLEFIIIDGGSSDNTTEIFGKYSKHLSFWISEPDRGQSHALNKGLRRAQGEIIGWLNADDTYCRGTLAAVANHFYEDPGVELICGHGLIINAVGSMISRVASGAPDPPIGWPQYFTNRFIQPSVFFRRHVLGRVGYLDESLHYVMDHDFWIRAFGSCRGRLLNRDLSCFRRHEETKTAVAQSRFWFETLLLVLRYRGSDEVFRRLLGKYVALFIEETGTRTTDAIKDTRDRMKVIYPEVTKRFDRLQMIELMADIHLQLGIYRYESMDMRAARYHFRRAYRLKPSVCGSNQFWRHLLPSFMGRRMLAHLRRWSRGRMDGKPVYLVGPH